MKRMLKLYLGGTGYYVSTIDSSNSDMYVLTRIDYDYQQCLLKNIPCMYLYVPFNGLDGEYNWQLRFKEYKTKEKEIIDIIKEYKKVLLICGLGGDSGSSLYVYISTLCKKLNIECDSVVTLPFDFEGYKRTYYAIKALNMGTVNNVIPIDLTYLKSKFPKKMSILDMFKYIDYLIYECVKFYEENDVNSKELGVNCYSKIINNVDESWIKQIHKNMMEVKNGII